MPRSRTKPELDKSATGAAAAGGGVVGAVLITFAAYFLSCSSKNAARTKPGPGDWRRWFAAHREQVCSWLGRWLNCGNQKRGMQRVEMQSFKLIVSAGEVDHQHVGVAGLAD